MTQHESLTLNPEHFNLAQRVKTYKLIQMINSLKNFCIFLLLLSSSAWCEIVTPLKAVTNYPVTFRYAENGFGSPIFESNFGPQNESLTLTFGSGIKNVEIDFKNDPTLAADLHTALIKGVVEEISYNSELVKLNQQAFINTLRGIKFTGKESRFYFVKLRPCSIYVRLGDNTPDDELELPAVMGYLTASHMRKALAERRNASAMF